MEGNFCLQLSLTRGVPGDSSFLWFPFSAHEVLLWSPWSRSELYAFVWQGREVKQLSSVWSRWTEVLQGTLLHIKLPKGCSSHSGRYTGSPGYVSSHLYWCHPPMSKSEAGISSHTHQSLIGHLCLWVDHECVEEPWILSLGLYSFLGAIGGELVAQNVAVLL